MLPKEEQAELLHNDADSDSFFYGSQEQMFEHMMDEERNLGRYVLGWRQYENYQFYQKMHPKADISDYMNEMNRQVTFDEYLQIVKDYIR
jgi:hypothetical protein